MDRLPAGRGRYGGEAVAGHRRDDHIEGIRGVAAVGGRVGERADDVEQLDDRAGPAVGDDQRQGALVRRPDVEEVDVEAVDPGDERWEGVQPGLEPPRVVAAGPVVGQCLVERADLGGVLDGAPRDELPSSRRGLNAARTSVARSRKLSSAVSTRWPWPPKSGSRPAALASADGQSKWPVVALAARRLASELARPGGDRVAGQDPVQLGAGADIELGEHLAQVVLDRAGTDEQPGADLGV